MPLKLIERNGWYHIRGSVRGLPVYESTKTRDPKVAEAIRAKREAALTDESVFGAKAVVTFAQAADAYVKATGKSKYLLDVLKTTGEERGLVPLLGSRKLHTLRQADLDKAAEKLRPGTSPATRNRCVYTPFIAVWNHAASASRQWADKRDWERPREPRGTAYKRRAGRSGTKPVAYEYAWEFVRAMSPAPACVMTALFYTGMRPIELFSLEAHEVSVKDRWIALSSTKTEPRGVPMHEMLVPLFTKLVERGGILFHTPRDMPYPIKDDGGGQLKSAINGARGRSKIMDVSPYTARHTVSTQLVLNHVHPHVKDQILGHAVTDMSRNYTWVPQKPLIEAINTLPVIEAWQNAPWLNDPLKFQRRLVRFENNGRRGGKLPKSVQGDLE